MIKRKSEQETQVRKDMRGGTGEVTIRHYFKKDEINAASRLCAELRLLPGVSIGDHEHVNEDEVFIIDFETASINRRVSNITSISHFLFMYGKIAETITAYLGKINKSSLISALKAYKLWHTKENYKTLLDVCLPIDS